MAMRTYGVETKGMIITLNDFQVLLSLNKSNIENKFELKDRWQEIFEDIDNADFSEIIDFTYNIDLATFIGEFNGCLDIERTQERVYYGDRYGGGEDIILFELKKNNLFEKYENRDEIITELKETLSNVGIIVDNDYIEEHFGYVSGSYIA